MVLYTYMTADLKLVYRCVAFTQHSSN